MSVNLLAQAVFGTTNNISADRTVNTFHFIGDSASADDDYVGAAYRVHDFYSGPAASSSTAKLDYYLANDSGTNYHINVYDMADPKPRLPHVFNAQLIGAGVLHDVPAEVALCASYYSGRNIPRQRGRIFLGPLCLAALETTGAGPARPKSDFLDAIQAACVRLATTDDGVVKEPVSIFEYAVPADHHVSWAVHSVVANTWLPVTAGWIDNSFDTQRRRGPKATNRHIWGPVI